MPLIDQLLEANRAQRATFSPVESPRPQRHLAVLTCMDARIDVFALLGLRIGDAHVLRNAGARVTEDVLRSLALSVHAFGVDTVLVMQHTRCGLRGSTDAELQALTGADLDFRSITDHTADLQTDVDLLADTAFLSPVSVIVGGLLDVDSGAVERLVDWKRA